MVELPPGETSCFLYLNGPAAGLGVIASAGLMGVMSSGGSVLGVGGLASTVYAAQPQPCPTMRRDQVHEPVDKS